MFLISEREQIFFFFLNSIMGKIKPQMNKFSQDEADTISKFVKVGLDILVKLTGGKPTFGDKK